MKSFHKIAVIAFLWIAILTTDCNAGDPKSASKGDIIHLTNATFKAQIFDYEKNNQWKYLGSKPAIIDFYADWCGPCRMMAPILEQVAKEYKGQIIVYKVNTDVERELSSKLGITSLPTLVFIPVEGQPQATMGAIPKETLVKIINEVLLKKK